MTTASVPDQAATPLRSGAGGLPEDLLSGAQVQDLVFSFARIRCPALRAAAVRCVQALAAQDDNVLG